MLLVTSSVPVRLVIGIPVIRILPLRPSSGKGGGGLLPPRTGMANWPRGNPWGRASGVVGSRGPPGGAAKGEPPGSPTYQIGAVAWVVLLQNTALLMSSVPAVVPRAA